MKSTTVLVATNASEARWALSKEDKVKNCKIIASSVSSQLALQDAGRFAFDLYENTFFRQKNFYNLPLKKIIDQAIRLKKHVSSYFSDIYIADTLLIDAVSILVENEFTHLLFNYQLVNAIEKEWQPKKYLFPAKTTQLVSGSTSEAFTFLPFAEAYFLPSSKVSHYGVAADPQLSPTVNFLKKLPNKLKTIYQMCLTYLNQQFIQLPRQTNVLLFSSGFNLYYHRHTIAELAQKTNLTIITGNQSASDAQLLQKEGIKFVPLSLLRNNSIRNAEVEVREKTKRHIDKAMQRLRSDKQLPQLFTRNIHRAVCDCIEQILHKQLEKVVQQSLLAREAITECRPRLVITTHDPGPSAVPFVYSARKRNIPQLVLLHGWNDIKLGQNHYSDSIQVWGPEIKKWYIHSLHKNPKTIFTTGFAHLQETVTKTKRTTKINNRVFGLLLTLYPPNTLPQYKFLDELFKAAAVANYKGEFWLRVHAGQRTEGITQIASRYQRSLVINPTKTLEEFVEKADVLLGWDTTALYWPMILGKPLFYTTPLWGEGITPIRKFKAGWIPNNASQVFETIEKIRHQKNMLYQQQLGQKKFLKEVLGVNGKKAAKKTAELILFLSQPSESDAQV